MSASQLQRYERRMHGLRDRITEEILRLAEFVRTGAQAVGEHDLAVSESVDKEVLLERNEENIREQISQALQRIEEGTFGNCQSCEGPIDRERLELIPYTQYCVACERTLEDE